MTASTRMIAGLMTPTADLTTTVLRRAHSRLTTLTCRPNSRARLISPPLEGPPPRTTAPQTYYAQQGYNTPPRVGQPSSTLYNVISNERGTTNGTSANEVYATPGDMTSTMQNGYSAQPPVLNGASSLKRGRDDDDDRPTSGGHGMPTEMKRRKTLMEGGASMPSPSYNSPVAANTTAPAIASSQRRR